MYRLAVTLSAFLALAFADAPASAQTPGALAPLGGIAIDSRSIVQGEALQAIGTETSAPTIAFQGVLSDGGAPVSDGSYSVTVALFGVATGGNAVYSETHTVGTTGGTFALSIGGGTPETGSFDLVTFADETWVEVAVGATTLGPRTLLLAVPHARSLTAGAEISGSVSGAAVRVANSNGSSGSGISGSTSSFSGRGVTGSASSSNGNTFGVYGASSSSQGIGVYGEVPANSGSPTAIYGFARGSTGTAIRGLAQAGSGETVGLAIDVNSPDGIAGRFTGGRGVRIANEGGSWDTTATVYASNASTENGVAGWFESSGTGPAIVASKTTFGDIFHAYANGQVQLRITDTGRVYSNGAFLSTGADFAEYFPTAHGEGIAPGQAVGITAGRVSLRTEGAEQVAVVSSNPAFAGNSAAAGGGVLVALVGQAEVRFSGAASAGDLLVASGREDGTARAVAPTRYEPATDGPVIGRVLSVDGDRAVALVGVDEAAALREVVVRQQQQIDALLQRLEAVERRITPTTASR